MNAVHHPSDLFQAILLFLFPIGAYCLLLANVNRRARPLLLSGTADVALMLAAGSGFFLAFLPALFDQLYHRSIAGPAADKSFAALHLRWWALWLFYYLALVGWSLLLLSWRRHATVIYNVDAELLFGAFAQAARGAGLECHSEPARPGRYSLALASPADTALSAAPLPRREVASVAIDSFPAGCHVTLHWDRYKASVRSAFEAQLAKALEGARPADNPLAGWFLVISGLVFGLIALVVVTVYLNVYFPRP
jgi:hypothetical protein